jgi:hypothetical protein
VSGKIFLPPKVGAPVPAMLMIHGSDGKDVRTEYFADELPKHDIAAFVVDYKTGILLTPSDRPPNDVFIAATFKVVPAIKIKGDAKRWNSLKNMK